MNGARAGWVAEAVELREMAEDVRFVVRTLTLFMKGDLHAGRPYWRNNAVTTRIGLLETVCRRVVAHFENLGMSELNRRRLRLRQIALQLELPLWE